MGRRVLVYLSIVLKERLNIRGARLLECGVGGGRDCIFADHHRDRQDDACDLPVVELIEMAMVSGCSRTYCRLIDVDVEHAVVE